MSQGANEIALYAIMLREAGNHRHTGPESVFDEFCEAPGALSFASLLALRSFTDLDWEIAEMLYDHPARSLTIAKNLFEYEETLTAEALLHARIRYHGAEPKPEWTKPFRGHRWRDVREAILAFEGEGIAVSFDDINLIADNAYMEGTGATRDERRRKVLLPDVGGRGKCGGLLRPIQGASSC